MDDPMVGCPFDMAHWCKQSRIQKHLIKCRKNHPESKLEPCPYNATEYIHPDNLIEHLKVCKNATLLEGLKYDAERLKDHYLDAPFHIPTLQKPKSEDFENTEIQFNSYDEQILERSVSQMSVNCISDTNPTQLLDSIPSVTPSGIKSSASSNLPSRSSLRSGGRGYAVAGFMSALSQVSETDYSKYEIRSEVSEVESMENSDRVPISRRSPIFVKGISLFDLPEAEIFEDSFSDEETKSDNASMCDSDATVVENNHQAGSTKQSAQSTLGSKPPAFPSLLSDSEDEEEESYPFEIAEEEKEVDYSATSIFPSVDNREDFFAAEDEYESSSGFSSLIRANKMQNAYIVKSLERKKDWNRLCNRGRGQWHQSSNQYPTNSDRHWSKNPPKCAAMNENRTIPIHHPNHPDFPKNRDLPQQNQSDHQQEVSQHCNSNLNHASRFHQQKGRGNFNHSVGRGLQQSWGVYDMYHANLTGGENSVGRGNSMRRGNSSSSECSVDHDIKVSSNGNCNIQGNFNGKDSHHAGSGPMPLGRGNFRSRGSTMNHSGSLYEENPTVSGGAYNGNAFGRGQSNNQWKSLGRGVSLNQSSSTDGGKCTQEKSLGRGNSISVGHGSCFSNPGGGDCARTPIGRGRALMELTTLQSPLNKTDGYKKSPTDIPCVNSDNFRGKCQSEISNSSFQAVYDSFKDLQIVDFSPISSPAGVNKANINLKIPSGRGFLPKPSSSSSPAPPKDLNVSLSKPNVNKSKKGKNRKKKKKTRQASLEPETGDSSALMEPIDKDSQPTLSGPSIKILDKSMDPKKYFGSDGCEEMEPKQTLCFEKPKSDKSAAQIAAKPAKKKVSFNDKFVSSKNRFEVYDKFYSQMPFFSLNNEVNLDAEQEDQGIYNHHVSKGGRFSKRFESEKPVRSFASVNCIQVSNEPVQSSQENLSSSIHIPSNVSFSSLHSPQKPKFPNRYDRLSDTASYKFVFRHMNKKKSALNRKDKLTSKKGENSLKSKSSVCDSDKLILKEKDTVTPSPKLGSLDNAKTKSQQFAADSHFKSDSGFNTQIRYHSLPQSQNHIFGKARNKTPPINNKFTAQCIGKSPETKTSFAKSNDGSPQTKSSLVNQSKMSVQNKNMLVKPNEMSLWNRNYYPLISSGIESSFNYFPKSKIPQHGNFSIKNVKNAQSKKPSLTVSKKKTHNSQNKPFNKNSSSAWQARPRFYNSQSFLRSLFSNPLEKPEAYGPSQSCHLQYASKKPLAFSPFDLN